MLPTIPTGHRRTQKTYNATRSDSRLNVQAAVMYLLSISECICLGCSQIYGLPLVTFMQKQKLNNDGQGRFDF